MINYARSGGALEDPCAIIFRPFPKSGVLIQDASQTHFRAGGLSGTWWRRLELWCRVGGNYSSIFHRINTQRTLQVSDRFPPISVLVQRPGMNEPERDAFLAAFFS